MPAGAIALRWPREAAAQQRRPAISPARERARRQVVRLVFVIYLLAIFEGSLRKWVWPEWGSWLFFVRDPVLLVTYAIATMHGLWPRRDALFTVTLLMLGGGVGIALLQAAAGGFAETRALLAVYGWRSYFLYVPLAFLIGRNFGADDLRRLYTLTLCLAVPIAVLVTLQFFSPPGAAINVGIAADEEFQFRGLGLNAERTRPMGPFSSGAGQQQFVATACAIVVGLLVAPRTLRKPAWVFVAAAVPAVLTCIALGGSRGTLLQCVLAGVFALGVGLLGRGAGLRARALLWPLVIGAAAIVLYPLVFPEGFAAFTERWTAADSSESRHFEGGVFGRALYGLVDFVRLVDSVPTLGYGLGYGGNASITLKATVDGVMPGQLAETDFARHMVDLGPVFGFGYIAFRLVLAAVLAARVLRVTRLTHDPMPMLLLSYVAYVVVMGQLTGQGAINVYGWLFTGLLIAACNVAQRPRPPLSPKPAPRRSR